MSEIPQTSANILANLASVPRPQLLIKASAIGIRGTRNMTAAQLRAAIISHHKSTTTNNHNRRRTRRSPIKQEQKIQQDKDVNNGRDQNLFGLKATNRKRTIRQEEERETPVYFSARSRQESPRSQPRTDKSIKEGEVRDVVKTLLSSRLNDLLYSKDTGVYDNLDQATARAENDLLAIQAVIATLNAPQTLDSRRSPTKAQELALNQLKDRLRDTGTKNPKSHTKSPRKGKGNDTHKKETKFGETNKWMAVFRVVLLILGVIVMLSMLFRHLVTLTHIQDGEYEMKGVKYDMSWGTYEMLISFMEYLSRILRPATDPLGLPTLYDTWSKAVNEGRISIFLLDTGKSAFPPIKTSLWKFYYESSRVHPNIFTIAKHGVLGMSQMYFQMLAGLISFIADLPEWMGKEVSGAGKHVRAKLSFTETFQFVNYISVALACVTLLVAETKFIMGAATWSLKKLANVMMSFIKRILRSTGLATQDLERKPLK